MSRPRKPGRWDLSALLSRVHAAIRRRMLRAPGSFLWPPAREARAAVAP
jgi:hypothetical protein